MATLGLDIGGANLKAATADGRAASAPFALWKHPHDLPAALAELVARFPGAAELAVTMTGELCDCFETKRDGVNAILDAVERVGVPARAWSTDGVFVGVPAARAHPLKVAAANWHALATFAGRFAPHPAAMLLDIGSTTSDLIPLTHGVPSTSGTTDDGRLRHFELVYAGVRRTPVAAVYHDRVAAEFFASTQDVYVVLGLIPEEPENRDTADGRPATVEYSLARLARMLGGDRDTLPDDAVIDFAVRVHGALLKRLAEAARAAYYSADGVPPPAAVVVSGAGEFLARRVAEAAFAELPRAAVVSLAAELGPAVSASAPAFAAAVLAGESPVTGPAGTPPGAR